MKSNFNRYKALLMLFFFTVTVLWGLSVVVIKSPAIASTILRPDTLKIAQLSDIHYDSCMQTKGARMISNSQELLEDAICQINKMEDVDLVVFSGDSINQPNECDLPVFIKIANNLKMPWYVALGNHEVNQERGLTKEKYFQILTSLNLNYASINAFKPYYIITPKKEYKVIFLDGVNEEKLSSEGEFSEEQLAWLDKKLNQYRNKKIIIVQHFPIIPPYKTTTRNHEIKNAKEYLNILDKHNNVIVVLAGHYHCSKVVKRNNVLHITTPALVQYPNAFRTITISSTQSGITKVEYQLHSTNLCNIKEKSRQATGPSKVLLEGSKADASNVFYLSK